MVVGDDIVQSKALLNKYMTKEVPNENDYSTVFRILPKTADLQSLLMAKDMIGKR